MWKGVYVFIVFIHTHTRTNARLCAWVKSDPQMGSCPLKQCLETGCYWKPYLCTGEPHAMMDTRHHIRAAVSVPTPLLSSPYDLSNKKMAASDRAL